MDKKFFSIKRKLRISFIAIIVIAALGGIYSYFLMNQALQFNVTKDKVYRISLSLDEARKIEKDFLLYTRKDEQFLETGTTETLDKHKNLIEELKVDLESLKEEKLIRKNDLGDQVDSIELIVLSYEKSFTSLMTLYFERGFQDYGVEGEMRETVHGLQMAESPEEQVFAFSLRRHEKDFLMRLQMKYYDRLYSTAMDYKDFVQTARLPHMSDEYVAASVAAIQEYVDGFKKLVDIEEKIGLDENSGIIGDLNRNTVLIKPAVDNLLGDVEEISDNLKDRATVITIISILLPLVIGLWLTVFLSRRIARPIVGLNKYIQSIVEGTKEEMPEYVNTDDEIGSLSSNFSKMYSEIEEQLDEISKQNQQLEVTAKEDEKRNWVSEGLALFSDLMKNQDSEIDEFTYNVISHLVKYTKSNQGGIFLLENPETDEEMELKASYAYDRRKYNDKKVMKGEGLIGSAWFEKDIVFLTDVPNDYINITSGLGGANPSCVLIVPILYDELVLGAIEIASFEVYDDFEIDFVKQIAERFGGVYNSLKVQVKTRRLLEETTEMKEQLQASEEELRQNMEELSATQEELGNRNIELERKMKEFDLKAKIANDISDRIFDGRIILDSSFKIHEINQPASEMLKTDQSIIGSNIDVLPEVKSTFDKVIDSDTNFLANDLSSRHSVKKGLNMVTARVDTDSGKFYAILLESSNNSITKTVIQ